MHHKNKILYIHGLSSSGASSTAQKLREDLPDFNVLSPDLPIHPDEALALLHSVCEAEKPQILIGTSMGGMFAQQIRGFKKILVSQKSGIERLFSMGFQVLLLCICGVRTGARLTPLEWVGGH